MIGDSVEDKVSYKVITESCSIVWYASSKPGSSAEHRSYYAVERFVKRPLNGINIVAEAIKDRILELI